MRDDKYRPDDYCYGYVCKNMQDGCKGLLVGSGS